MRTRRWPRRGRELLTYLRYFNEERPLQGLDNRTPTMYYTNENRLSKQHNPTRQYT